MKQCLQESTFYKEGDRFAPKDFSFKLQGVKGRSKSEKPQTFAKMELDMAAYCNCGEPGSRELEVELRCLSCSEPNASVCISLEAVNWTISAGPGFLLMPVNGKVSTYACVRFVQNWHH